MSTGQVRRAGVLGHPISHSKSPALHMAAYAGLGLDWSYEAYDVNIAGLPDFIASLDDSWAGLSLTMPLKEAVIPLLAEVSDQAGELRSVNTVLPGRDLGTWQGVNTDVGGIVSAVREAAPGAVLDHATILGSGATARSAVAALPALGVSSVTICARNAQAAQEVASLARHLGLRADTQSLEPDAQAAKASLLVSTLPGTSADPWADVVKSTGGVLLDASYFPWPTALAQAWRGVAIASGRDMLLWQAVEQVRLMTGLEPDPAAMRAAMERESA